MIWVIARREIVTRSRSRGFQAIMAIMFLAVIAAGIVPRLVLGDGEPRDVTIGVVDVDPALIAALEVGNEDLAPELVPVAAADVTRAIEDGDVDVVFTGDSLTWEALPDFELDTYIRGTAQGVAFGQRAEDLGLGGPAIEGLFAEVTIEEVRLDGGDDEFIPRVVVAGIATLATFVLLQTWGSFMTLGVIEEKSSRVIEILLSHVRPSTLLAGKLIGLGVLALAQMLVLVAGVVVGLVFWEGLVIPEGIWNTVPILFITFILGFGFYATGFAAAGAMVPRVEDAQSTQFLVMLPLFLGYIIAASTYTNPSSTVVTVASFVPFTSPVLLPFRVALVDPPLWQVGLSLAILAVSTVLMVRLAGAVYRYSLLRTGSKVSWLEALRNAKTAEL